MYLRGRAYVHTHGERRGEEKRRRKEGVLRFPKLDWAKEGFSV